MLHDSYLMAWAVRPDEKVSTVLSWLRPSFIFALWHLDLVHLSLQGVPSGLQFISPSLQLKLLTQQPCNPCFSILQRHYLAGICLQCTINASG